MRNYNDFKVVCFCRPEESQMVSPGLMLVPWSDEYVPNVRPWKTTHTFHIAIRECSTNSLCDYFDVDLTTWFCPLPGELSRLINSARI